MKTNKTKVILSAIIGATVLTGLVITKEPICLWGLFLILWVYKSDEDTF